MKSNITEKQLTPAELKKREEVIKKLKSQRSSLVKRYGKDAEKVMYGRATNIAKKAVENMNKDKVREMVKKTLMSPVKEDHTSNPNDRYVVKYSKENNTYQVWEGDYLVTDFATKEKANAEAKRLNRLEDIKQLDKANNESKKSFPDLTGDGKVTKADILKGRGVDIAKEVQDAKDAVDTITMDVPLFIRMLEYAREDASTDVDLHDVAEKAIEINKGKETLSMQDYEDIVPAMESMDEGLPKGFWKKETAELDETFEKLVGKLKKQGKSEKAAKAIAGAVAQYKAKGGGKGPTSKQAARLKEEISDVDAMRKYIAKYAKPEDVEKEISKYKLAGFQAFSEPVKIGLRSDMDFITWVQMKHDEQQLRREKGL